MNYLQIIIQFANEFPNTTLTDVVAPCFGVVAAVTIAAVCAPICKDGWFMSATWAAMMTAFTSFVMTNVYFDGILYDSKANRWQKQLEARKFVM